MKKIFFAVVMMFSFSAVALADGWQVSKDQYGQYFAQVSIAKTSPNSPDESNFSILCGSGKGDGFVFKYTVKKAQQIKKFPFNNIEGPDGRGAKGEVRRVSSKSSTPIKFFFNGSYSAADEFTFEDSNPNNKRGPVSQLLDLLKQEPAQISLIIHGGDKANTVIETTIPTAGGKNAAIYLITNCARN